MMKKMMVYRLNNRKEQENMKFEIRNEKDELFCKGEIDSNGETKLITKYGHQYKEISHDYFHKQIDDAKKNVI